MPYASVAAAEAPGLAQGRHREQGACRNLNLAAWWDLAVGHLDVLGVNRPELCALLTAVSTEKLSAAFRALWGH